MENSANNIKRWTLKRGNIIFWGEQNFYSEEVKWAGVSCINHIYLWSPWGEEWNQAPYNFRFCCVPQLDHIKDDLLHSDTLLTFWRDFVLHTFYTALVSLQLKTEWLWHPYKCQWAIDDRLNRSLTMTRNTHAVNLTSHGHSECAKRWNYIQTHPIKTEWTIWTVSSSDAVCSVQVFDIQV